MVFSSLAFLIVFLPLLAILFFMIPARRKHARQYLLLLASLLFYGAGEPLYIFLILASTSATWLLSSGVSSKRKSALVLAILANLLPLILTKYAGSLLRGTGLLFGVPGASIPEIAMPIGISFYTFQAITYIVDLYEGRIARQRDPLLFALYIMFFPQLVAGPIVKYSEIEKELETPDVSWERIRYGSGRFIIGLGKKVLIANQAGYIASAILRCAPNSVTTGMAWLCVAAYTVQIYFDFSGYSDMAIGLGSIFGFHFPENFQDPYTSRSVTDFWRRWHITLGRFFREYVYIPLGGNRVAKPRWILNILLVWALTGLWHGASWNFVLWGIYYCFLVLIEKNTGIGDKLPKTVGWAFTLFFVMLGWGIFMCDGVPLSQMFGFLGKLFFVNGRAAVPVSVGSLRLWGYMPFLMIGFMVATPFGVSVKNRVIRCLHNDDPWTGALADLLLIAVLLASLFFLIGGSCNPFLYFRF